MRFFVDDLAQETDVEWYEVKDTAPVIPYGHPFASRDADFHEGYTGLLLGEVAGTRRYRAGAAPVDFNGQGFCGTRDQWENGCSILDKPVELNSTTQRQCCCGRGTLCGPVSSVIGVDVDIDNPPLITTCPAWNPAPAQWRVHLDPYPPPDDPCWPGGIVLPDQDTILSANGPCRWDSGFWPPVNLQRWRLWRLAPPPPVGGATGWYLFGSPPTLPSLSGGPTWFVADGNWNRYGPNEMTAIANGGGCLLPTVTVYAVF